MTEYSAPWEGQLIGDASNAPYSADEWSGHWAKMLGFAARANVGPVMGYDNGSQFSLEVTATSPTSKNVEIKIGSALVVGTLYTNSGTVTLPIANNTSGNARVDTVVLRKDYVLQTIRLAVLQGTPAASPVPPTLTQSAGTTWEIPIADVAVANGFSAISQVNITPRHEWANASPGVYLDQVLNNSGAVLQTGDVVIWDTSTARAVTTTTTRNHPRVAGVWVGRTANGARGRLQVKGIGWVRINTSVDPTRYFLVTSTTAKQATVLDPGGTLAATAYILGRSIAAASTGELALVELDVRPVYNYGVAQVEGGSGGFTSGAWRTRPLSSIAELGTGITLSSNQLTFPIGMYHIFVSAPAFNVDGHQIRLHNISGGASDVFGTSEIAPTGQQSRSVLNQRLDFRTNASPQVFEIQHQCETTKATNGMGRDVTFSTTQRHLMCMIYRENDDTR